jgi:hypothetical protein
VRVATRCASNPSRTSPQDRSPSSTRRLRDRTCHVRAVVVDLDYVVVRAIAIATTTKAQATPTHASHLGAHMSHARASLAQPRGLISNGIGTRFATLNPPRGRLCDNANRESQQSRGVPKPPRTRHAPLTVTLPSRPSRSETLCWSAGHAYRHAPSRASHRHAPLTRQGERT